MSAMNLNSNTYGLNAGTSSTSIQLTEQDAQQSSFIVYNTGTSPVQLVSGKGSAPTAVLPSAGTGNQVPGKYITPGVWMFYKKTPYDDYLAGISVSGTNELIISVGQAG